MRIAVVAAVLGLSIVGISIAGPADASIRRETNIPAQPLAHALQLLARQRGLVLAYRSEVVGDRPSAGAVGELTTDEALTKILSGTGLSYKYLDANTITVFATAAPAGVDAAGGQDQTNATQDNSKEAGKKSSQDFRVAQATPGQTSGPSTVEKLDEKSAEKKKGEQLQEVVVTGSRIPTVAGQGPQDVKVYPRENIEQSGQTTVADFISTLPSVSVAIGENGFQTTDYATTVQLHGLPVGTTLVLINGRRVETSGPQSGAGEFFDLNNIPLAAVDRIELVSEGSSAIYGSDAIAGVVNIIMKKDFNGLEANIKYGGAAGIHETDATLAWGKNWEKGSLSVLGSYVKRSELSGFEHDITANENYTRFGGIDARASYCNPGNVFSTDGTNLPGVGAPEAGVPAGYTGTPTQQEFAATAGKLNECSLGAYDSLIPETEREGFLASGNYETTSSVELFTEVLVSHVQTTGEASPQLLFAIPGYSAYTVAAANPYNPFGKPVGIGYLFTGLGPTTYPVDTTYFRTLVGIRGKLLDSWKWEIAGWDSHDRSSLVNGDTANSSAIQNALNSPTPATALNPFTVGPPGSPQLLSSLFFNQLARYTGQTLATDALVRGPVFQLPAGPIQMAIGAEFDEDRLYSDQVNNPFYPPNQQETFQRSRFAAYAEARIPILGNPASPPGGNSLAATIAGRYDEYSDFGDKTTPQLGIEWRPLNTLLLRGTYAQAFKAPSLFDLKGPSFTFQQLVADPLLGNQTEAVTEVSGSNPQLRPETGQSRTLGLVYSSKAIPNLQLSVSHWSIDESNSIQSLLPQTLVDNENLFPGRVVRASNCASGPPCPITELLATFVNFGDISVRGLDYQLNYKLVTSLGEWNPSIAATETYRYSVALTPGSLAIDASSVAQDSGNWAPRWKGTLALGWRLGPYSASLDGRYVGRYQDYDRPNYIGNFWLCDASIRWALGETLAPGVASLRGAYVVFGGVNMFNRLPQFSNYVGSALGYDPAEADIRGRYLYVQIGVKL